MAFTNNRLASRFLKKGIRAMEFLDTMDRVIPREKLVNMINESILDRVDEL